LEHKGILDDKGVLDDKGAQPKAARTGGPGGPHGLSFNPFVRQDDVQQICETCEVTPAVALQALRKTGNNLEHAVGLIVDHPESFSTDSAPLPSGSAQATNFEFSNV